MANDSLNSAAWKARYALESLEKKVAYARKVFDATDINAGELNEMAALASVAVSVCKAASDFTAKTNSFVSETKVRLLANGWTITVEPAAKEEPKESADVPA